VFQQPAFGIELGDGALKAVKVERRGTRLVVTFADYRPYARPEDGAARPIAGLDPRAFATLSAFLAEHRPSPLSRVYVGMPSIGALNRVVRVPDVGEDQLESIADYELHRSVRGPLEDYVHRTRVLRGKGESPEVSVALFALPRKLRDAFISDLSRAGLEFDMLVPSPAALAQFARYDRPFQGTRIVVSIGLRATEVVYEKDGAYCFRTLPLGCVGFKAIPKTDETGRNKAARKLVKKLTYEIGAGSAFFFGDEAQWDPQAVSLFGEGAIEPEIVTQFDRHYKGRLEAIGRLHRIGISPSVAGDGKQHVAQMGSALGLAILAARADESEIELVQPHKARAAARRVPILAAVSLALAFVAGAVTWRDVRATERAGDLAAFDFATGVAARRAEFAALKRDLAAATARDEAIAGILKSRAPRARALTAVWSTFGPEVKTFGETDVRLRRLVIERAPTGTTLSGEALVVEGDPSTAVHAITQRWLAAGDIANPRVERAGDDEAGTHLRITAATKTP
jgi:hypothetical protein